MANEFKVRKGLIVNGSGSTILDIQGSQGQLFSVTDQLSGSLFSVNDISGVPVLEAFSDSTVKIGQYLAEAIIVSGSTARITGSMSLDGFLTGSVLFAGTGGAISQNNSKFFWDNSTNRLGIGTNSPLDFNLVVQGVIQVRNTANSYTGLRIDHNSIRYRTTGTFGLGSNDSATAINIFSTNNVGINTTSDSGERLQVSGSSRFMGNMVISGSSNTSATNALTIVNSSSANMLRMLNDTTLKIGSQNIDIFPTANGSTVSNAGRGLVISTNASSQTDVGALKIVGAYSSALGSDYGLWISHIFTNGTSGVATHNGILLNQTINQTGGANGITRGLYINPTLTAAADFRAIEWSNNVSGSTSWGLYGAGTAPNLLNGSLVVNSSITASLALISGSGSQRLTVQGSGSSILTVDGALGRLFSVDDAASGSLFSVNTISGLPIMEAFSDNTVRIGQFGQRALFVSQSRVGIGKEDSLNATLDVSGSMALTGSFNHQGNYTTNGTITAQTLVISTISSSVLYSSGSNVFGNSLSNTQVLTGSVSITGSLTSNGDVVIRGSGNTSATTALTIQHSAGTNLFRVRNDGLVFFGTQDNYIYPTADGSNPSTSGRGLIIATNAAGQTGAGVLKLVGSYTATSGNDYGLWVSHTFTNGTSGTAIHNGILLNQTINQTGGANGITRGLYVNPTLTSAADFRAIEWSHNAATAPSASWGLYGSGSAPNYLSGSLNIGTTATGSNILNIAGNSNFNGSITLAGNISSTSFGGSIQAGNTFTFYSSNGNINAVSNLNISLTGNATGVGLSRTSNITLTSGAAYWLAINTTGVAFAPTTGSATMSGIIVSPTINQSGDANGITRGVHVNPTLTSAWDYRSIEWTNNASATSGSWGLYGSGSAPSYLSGSLNIGTTLTGSSILNVVGSSTLNGNVLTGNQIIVGGASATAGILNFFNGNVGIARTGASGLDFRVGSNTVAATIFSTANVLVQAGGSHTDDGINRLQVTGNARISQALTASQALISGSGTQRLVVVGSGSAQPLFTVQGSQGELFSIVDSLSGSLFSVNDQSGLPIMEVFSDNTILMGNYLDPMLLTTTKTGSAAGINTIYSLPTSSYDAVYIDYTIRSGSNARAGNFMAMWSGTSVNFTDNSITEFGSTSTFTFGAHVSGANMVVTGSAPTAGWTIKTIIKAI